MATGRPTKLTPEIQKTIMDALRRGSYMETAAAYAGISKNTLYDWLRRGAREKQRLANNSRARMLKDERPFVEFSDAIKKAQAEAELRDLEIIRKAAEEGEWQASAWRLERKFPDKFGRRVIDVNATHRIEDVSDARFQKIVSANPELFDELFPRQD